ncbi:MBL fold metallo-hydrolase [Rhodoplanes sp. TEM]|uniref:MBL fold metallo-hydrolase n=1 Tax=Rhodoplanes tepidamans TaxID=200616 RepID=A0ABT5JJV1_RHOTP|nr:MULTISPECIES: MBL fold metallo-hydrolase [Rhodoplanes]MDC7789618.1 MBL fold metallo-hydrolase [Rhodoplanes tepidamans]MDC7986640.1 MBL fold metallo-hydrolase [Rhodoplanes sp. TEM]MDQ0354034.1 glyoxylase-like metal-dependent hydrolase (beta-lactamase superfamily II) [Rhodoplanes tepidamans]
MTVSRRIFTRGAILAPAALAGPALLRVGDAGEAAAAGPVEAPQAQTPQVQRRRVGEIEVIALMDGALQRPTGMLLGYDETAASAAATLAHRRHDPAALTLGINGYVIRTGDRVIAVDTGSPAGLAPTLGRWHAALAAAGLAADRVDTVVLTHPHPDHVGGMTDPRSGMARLARAQVIASAVDWAFTFDAAVYAASPREVQVGFDISRAMIAPYDAAKTLIAPGAEVAPGLTTVAMPGHTPGHMGLRVDSGRESLLIWGDLLIAPAYQFAHPDWAFALDADKAAAAATRARVLDMAAADRIMVAGMHLDFPGFGHVERARQGYGFVAAPWDYRA